MNDNSNFIATEPPQFFGPYGLGRTLGKGEFGKVKHAQHVSSKSIVAIKFIKKSKIINRIQKAKLEREITILQTLSHKFVVKLHEVIETESYIGMIMACASGGELFEYIIARENLSENESARLFAQLIDGVDFLHSQGIVHRDLKLENLLLDQNRNLIITDFGFANVGGYHEDGMFDTSCGSPCYAAPELVQESIYCGTIADIWSCGVILYAMLCGTLPFEDDPDNLGGENMVKLYNYIIQTPVAFPISLSADARNLLGRLLVVSPSDRAKKDEIQNHKFLQLFKHEFQDYSMLKQTVLYRPLDDQEASDTYVNASPIRIPQSKITHEIDTMAQASQSESDMRIDLIQDDISSTYSNEDDLGPSIAVPDIEISKQHFEESNEYTLKASEINANLSSSEMKEISRSDNLFKVNRPRKANYGPRCDSIKSIPRMTSVEDFIEKHRVADLEKVKEMNIDVEEREIIPRDQDQVTVTHFDQPIIINQATLNDSDLNSKISKASFHSRSSAGTIKKVHFDEKKNSKPQSKIRYSMNAIEDNQLFHQDATRAQSMDLRPKDVDLIRTLRFSLMKCHSGPIDQRAITTMMPETLLDRAKQVLKDMLLEFTLTHDPFKVIAFKTVTMHPNLVDRSTTKFGIRAPFASLFQKIKFISKFGLRYNQGFDGSSALPPVFNNNRVHEDNFVEFAVTVNRIQRINGVYIVGLKRIKGDIWEFKRLYHDFVIRLQL